MPRSCLTCRSESRREIDKALARGEPTRSIALRFKLSNTSVERHKRVCVGRAMAKLKEVRELGSAETMLATVERSLEKAERMQERAEKTGDLKTGLRGIDTIVRVVELLAKLRGDLSDAITVVNVGGAPVDDVADYSADELQRRGEMLLTLAKQKRAEEARTLTVEVVSTEPAA